MMMMMTSKGSNAQVLLVQFLFLPDMSLFLDGAKRQKFDVFRAQIYVGSVFEGVYNFN